MPNAPFVRMHLPRKGPGSLDAAVRKLDKAARQDMKVLKQEILAVTKELQANITEEVSAETQLPKRSAKRRIRLFKGRKATQAFAGLRLGTKASIIHTGRIKGLRQRKGKVTSIPGVTLRGPAFLMNRNKWKGERRRVYQNIAGTAVAVSHPTEVVVIFERVAERKAQKLLRKAWRKARLRNPGLRMA